MTALSVLKNVLGLNRNQLHVTIWMIRLEFCTKISVTFRIRLKLKLAA